MKIKIIYRPGERLRANMVLSYLQRLIPSAGVKRSEGRITMETEVRR